jgi:type IV pilus assembly protein PilV
MKMRQQGVILIEALIGILIFSMGILALVAMQTAAVSAQSDAQYRIEAANYVNRMMSSIWLNADRTNPATLQASLLAFQHQAAGANCAFAGATSAHAEVTSWANDMTVMTPAKLALPGATPAMQQIVVNTAAGTTYVRVTITVCWKAPNDAVVRRHMVMSDIG